MFEHKFVKVDLTLFGGKPKEDYHKIVYDHEKEDWELVQIFSPGTAAYFDLIFKRKNLMSG
ncbi:DUF4177 domain-containing protein [Fredinandcohnia humi]